MATFTNPVIPGYHPDPSVCRVGDEYFLVTSTFTYFPGVPVFRSRNLVDWTQIGNVLDRPSQLDLSATVQWSSLGIYAPTIRHHDGRFWMITTVTGTTGAMSFYVTAEDPAGPWSDPTPVDVAGIDPDLAWDDEGRCWVHFSGLGGIARARIDDTTGQVLEGPEVTWSGTGLQYPEAPHLLQRDGTWYLLIAEGGTERGHAVSIARGPSPIGPWESDPANPILSHRSTDHPIQSTGHADLIEAADGTWWLVALGTRPRGVTPGFHVLGRETFLAPVEWADGWPVVADLDLEMAAEPPGPREPVVEPPRDDFDAPSLHPRWLTVRRPLGDLASLDTRPGWLTLTGGAATLDSPEPIFVGRRQQHHGCRARVMLEADAGVEAGLAVVMDETAHYEVAVIDDRVLVRARIGPLQSVVSEAPAPSGATVLVVETRPHGRGGPDAVCLGFEDDAGGFEVLAELDGRHLSTQMVGGFMGRVIGVYAVGGEAAFDWFDYEPLD
ncbi:MAG: glycoside hydrolase family 43 protein [Acidimicrobiales bacterium]